MEWSRTLRLNEHNNSFLLFLVLSSCALVVVSASVVVVDSPFGNIQGVKKTDKNTGLSYVSFQGIPYAKPPLGDLRFAKPQPHPKIADTFDATKEYKIICPHSDLMTQGETDFTEDCLILNVYVKDIDRTNSLKKVLVFIHGGGFRAGFGRFHNPKSFVIAQDIIVVTINYRIGILGFLSTENEASPGNYGLWDQTLAIKWVKDNIRAFGGDPDDIAIAGESAGGGAVGYQIISRHTKGLFSKAYAQSGASTSNFALTFNAQNHALSVAKSAGCWAKSVDDTLNIEESRDVITCLRGVSLAAITAFYGFSLVNVQFAPRMDGDFIPDYPAKLLQDDEYLDSIGFFDRTYLTGINNNEGQSADVYYQAIKTVASTEESVKAYLTRIQNNYVMSRLGETASSNISVSNEITHFYQRRFVNERSFIEITADVGYLLPSLDLVRTASRRENCNSYLFYFDYFPNFMKGSYTGMPHGADLLYWFDMEISSLENMIHAGMQGDMDDEDLMLKRLFSSLIGEFVRSGNPGIALKDYNIQCGWPRYDISNAHFLSLNSKPWIGSFLEKDKQDLWFDTIPRLTGTPDAMTGSRLESECRTNGAPCLYSYCNLLTITIVFALKTMSSLWQ